MGKKRKTNNTEDLLSSINAYARLYESIRLLEEEYKVNIKKRKKIYPILVKSLKKLNDLSEIINLETKEKLNTWKYSSLLNDKFIQLDDGNILLKIILQLANHKDNIYAVKTIKVIEFIKKPTIGVTPHISDITILGTKESLSNFDERHNYYSTEIYNALELLYKEGHSFIINSNTIIKYIGILSKEKIWLPYIENDLLLAINNDIVLDDCIEKIVSYMSKYGNDLSNIPLDSLVSSIDKEVICRKRKINNNRYIEYYK